jgi:hypothetical protein
MFFLNENSLHICFGLNSRQGLCWFYKFHRNSAIHSTYIGNAGRISVVIQPITHSLVVIHNKKMVIGDTPINSGSSKPLLKRVHNYNRY